LQGIFNGLITSKTRVKVLIRLFLNPDQRAYLRELAEEFDTAPSHIKGELQNLRQAGLLSADRNGRQIFYRANAQHPLFPELHSMVRKAMGMDRILESIIERLGELEEALLIDDYAQGKDTGLVDLLLVGRVNRSNLDDLVAKTERYIERKIRTLVLSREEYERMKPELAKRATLRLWQAAGQYGPGG
jgi:DNA-binding transcriptional ArsR family regulator